MNDDTENWLQQVNWNREGLVPAIAQDQDSGKVLTLAWMNHEALRQTLQKKQAVYWSRSRQRLWHKGERSGLFQYVREIRLDCDADTILLSVIQEGGVACHTGRASCFYLRLQGGEWQETEPVLIDPAKLYDDKPGDKS
ncbi:MAG: phosphoribosyl-AMP cyclohydrolase [Gammaproteobacteria bacterium]